MIADVLAAKLAHDFEQAGDVGRPERGGGLVEDQNPRPAQREHLRDLDELALGDRDAADLLRRIDGIDAHTAERLARRRDYCPLVDSERARGLVRQRDVVSDREVTQQAELLVDDPDA